MDYNTAIHSTPKDNWFNATTIAKRFNKRPIDWLRMPETKRYLHALYKKHDIGRAYLIEVRKINTSFFPRGTWFHPLLALPLVRWLDIRFALWCDEQLNQQLHGLEDLGLYKEATHAHAKAMSAILNIPLSTIPKKAPNYPLIGKERLLNWAISGQFCQLDRDALNPQELDILMRLETRNQLLTQSNITKSERKVRLKTLINELYQTVKP